MKQKLFSILALLLMAATGAWATDYTTLAVGDVIKVGDTFSPTADGAFNDYGFHGDKTYTLMRADVDNDGNVTEKTDGAYYVFKYVTDSNPYIHFGKAFAVTTISDGLEVTKIETGKGKGNLYYTLAVHEPTAASGYNITLDEGTGNKDSQNWEITPKSSELSGGEAVTVKYNGSREVKSVTVVKKAAKTPATVTTAPTGAAIVVVGKSTALVSGGAADGGTLMYRVTTTNTKPTSTDGFSDKVPTAQTITASGMVYVWYYVKGDGTHTDSEIAATAIEVPVADIIWDATNVSDLRVSGTIKSYEKEGVTLSGNADQIEARWKTDGIRFDAHASGGYTFTAPNGKKFTKIEMTLNGPIGWDMANLGNGWAFNVDWEKQIVKVTWTGSSAASTVDLLTGADKFNGEPVKSIAFYLSE